MAEALHRSSDIPNFDTYPANPEPLLPPESPLDRRLASGGALEQCAVQIGSALGRTVLLLRTARNRIQNIPQKAGETGEMAVTRLNDLADSAKIRAQQWGQRALARAEDLRTAAAGKASELGTLARNRYYRARLRANQVTREYPVHIVLIGALVGVAVGAGLRIWRANRES
jgi:hypothetical protein